MDNTRPVTSRTIDDLKSEGHFFAAGALAHALGYPSNSYGCHFGMRSTLGASKAAYRAGWEASWEAACRASKGTEA